MSTYSDSCSYRRHSSLPKLSIVTEPLFDIFVVGVVPADVVPADVVPADLVPADLVLADVVARILIAAAARMPLPPSIVIAADILCPWEPTSAGRRNHPSMKANVDGQTRI